MFPSMDQIMGAAQEMNTISSNLERIAVALERLAKATEEHVELQRARSIELQRAFYSEDEPEPMPPLGVDPSEPSDYDRGKESVDNDLLREFG